MSKQDNTGVEQRAAPPGRSTASLGEALYFDSGEHRLFGWLSSPGASAASVGMVICNPFGYEEICGHRSIRSFAEGAAAAGLPTLRFDYAGAGDSADIDPLADQIQCWSQNVAAAVAELQRRAGVTSVCLLGFRLGALLAVLAAQKCPAVRSLALIAPIVSGRRYVRELRTSSLVASLAEADRLGTSGAAPEPATGGALEVAGFSLSEASMATLAQIDLTKLGAPPVSQMLVIDRKDLPSARAWSESVAAAGVRTEYVAMPGFVEMMTTAAQSAIVPHAMIAATRRWLDGLREAEIAAAASAPPEAAPAVTVVTLPGAGRSGDGQVTERPVFFGSEVLLCGIVTEPLQTQLKRRAVILLNMGADHHVGANRLHVLLARRWAASGYLVMRVDLGGIGDSETRLGRPDDEVYPPAALEDIRAASDFMRTRYGACDITLVGLCSGAYHALRAAAAGLPISRAVMINPMSYYWSEGSKLDEVQLSDVVRNPRVYRKRLLSPSAWRRLLTGQVNLWRVLQVHVQRPWLTVESALRDLARRLHLHLPNDLGTELEEIAARGVQLTFVFARGEPGLDLLKIEGGSSVKRLGDRCRVHIIDCGDHTFSRSTDRQALEDILSAELTTRRTGEAMRPQEAQRA